MCRSQITDTLTIVDAYRCMKDSMPLKMIRKKDVVIKGRECEAEVYKCEKCGKLYASVASYAGERGIVIDDETYPLLGPKSYCHFAVDIEDASFANNGSEKIKCVVTKHKMQQCPARSCSKRGLETLYFPIRGKQGSIPVAARICPSCNKIYIRLKQYRNVEDSVDCINEAEVRSWEREFAEKKKMAQKAKNDARRTAREASRQTRYNDMLRKSKKAWEDYLKRIGQDAPDISTDIKVKDFVVRRTIFKCRHSEHVLKNVDAKIKIIDRKGQLKEKTIPAGYCSRCDIFFIMESTYQKLRAEGIPACRITEEKAYLKSNLDASQLKLAQRSILMEYGYSVSQQTGLSDTERRRILSTLVDLNILTRADIIGYLDFFINTKSSFEKYRTAVEKWRSDRDYISKYRKGSYQSYQVGSISKKY